MLHLITIYTSFKMLYDSKKVNTCSIVTFSPKSPKFVDIQTVNLYL